MVKINRIGDLPDWFDLKKYQGAESFGAREWYEQLASRKCLLMGNPKYPDLRVTTRPIFKEVTYKDENGDVMLNGALLYSGEAAVDHADAMSDWRESVGQAASRLRAAPFAVEQADHEYLKKAQPVASMTRSDLRDIVRQGAFNATCKGTSSLQEYLDSSMFDELPDDVSCEAIYHRPFAPEPVARAAVMVSLDSSNAEIRKAFDAWLKEARVRQQADAKRNTLSYANWVRYGLLPYLDLLIWEMETDADIPDRIMAAAISRYEDMGESNLRKTVAPLAADLMRNLSALQALAAIQILGDPETF